MLLQKNSKVLLYGHDFCSGIAMTPFEYLKSNPKSDVALMAEEAGTTYAYFEQIARGYRTSSIKLAKRLRKASGGVMSLPEIIPSLADEAA